MFKRNLAIYPGTFDPITFGHIDIIKRAEPLVDHLILGIAKDAGKDVLFTLDERLRLIQELLPSLESKMVISVEVFEGLLVDFARTKQAQVILRGLRAVSDFEYEFQMTGMNARLAPEIETVFLMASEKQQFISSRFVKKVACLGGDVKEFIPQNVEQALKQKLATRQT